ncbi:hypothetical protein B0T25DRAFT_203441 [Lasiosphaeria hispida]|uniref:SET domain-containing protein n=1 Tax=Lasiosphaeria hispida TaxID=260671 RepID=A0AAJ0HIK6_9PEZI|nr:hypothetical protein B0T25DRAFT_203441 [Lasiosphaeria hispida]
MTDKLPPLSTPIVPSQHSNSLPALAPAQHVGRKQETVEEEPYTIKCICGFADDDGNTIYCERCDTWQHIECYYPNNIEDALTVDFAHSCVDCEPRSLDRQKAAERQRARTKNVPVVEEEATDKKPKRPPSKSHKKKPKPTELQLNGHHPVTEHTKHPSPHDHPPTHTKKTKTSHKSSQSMSSQAPKRSPSYGNGRTNHGHPPSPATTPPDLPDDLEIHSYSDGFLSLYNDQTVPIVRVNSFAGLQVSNTMSDWLRDPEKLQKETGCSHHDVFPKSPANIESLKVNLDVEQTKKALAPSTLLQWQCLKAPTTIAKDIPLIELNGQIGFQASYSKDPENRWVELSSPLPFVLFHPMLPIYIDTRREGSEARFVRRSCRPNAVLETYLSDGREYHFWLVSDRQITAKEEITIPWDFRLPNHRKPRMLRILGLGDDEIGALAEPIIDEMEYQDIAAWVHLVLSEHGGCACNLGTDCAFARFHRNYYGKTQMRTNPTVPNAPNGAPKSKKRKPKTQHAISPTSTGHATNSRAASEGHMDDVIEHDGRSVSGSSRSKPPSRDMTPTARQGSFDTLGILTEPTDRDKRKVTMIEDSFRRMEQQQHHPQPPRKRKRVSDGTTTSTSKTKTSKTNSAVQTPTLPNGFTERHYVDAGTSRSKSGSPASTESPHSTHAPRKPGLEEIELAAMASRRLSGGPRATYCDASVQTDPEEGAWYGDLTLPPSPRRKYVSLAKRLMDNRHRLRSEAEQKRKLLEEQVSALHIDSPTDAKTPIPSPNPGKEPDLTESNVLPSVSETNDIPMPDAPAVSPTVLKPNGVSMTANPIKIKSPDLRVQMPPVPAFGSPTMSAPSTASTPLSAGASMVQSPFSVNPFANPFAPSPVNGSVAAPSPVKKKLSLRDYTKSRMNKGAASRPSIGTTILKPISNSDDPKSATSVENSGALDSPTAERLDEVTSSAAPSIVTMATATANEPV